jgi:thioredoxin reductase (NADPH)
MEDRVQNVVIVGSGPAGLTAAIYAARASLDPLIVEGLQPGGQLTTTTDVENYPGFPEGIDGTTLMMKMRGQAERFGARFVSGEAVSSDFSGRPLRVMLSEGDTLESATVIIATGASARYLGLESEQKLIGRGVSACATCDGAFYRNLPVAVVGGGDSAMEEALFLARLCSKVTIIHRRDELRASRIMGQRALAHEKIDVAWDSVVDEVLDVEKNEVTGLRLRNVKTHEVSDLEVSGLFLAIGHTPNTQAFQGQVAIDEQGFIRATDTATEAAGVFACGDVQDHDYKQAVTAAGSGCMAALRAERYLSAQEG